MKILVVDDHALVREGLHQVLKGLDEDICVLQAGTCAHAFTLADQHPDIDLVLLDYQLPDMQGLAGLAMFGRQHPELPVVMLSGTADMDTMRAALQGGAAGFVSKSSMSEALLAAVRQVLDGGTYSPPELQGDVSTSHPPITPLTRRQELVLQGLLEGRSNREIGITMHLSDETIKNHVSAILRNFGVQNRTQAVMEAARRGYRRASAK
ncbi:response regulator transcription factor [Rhodoferax sp. OV413]|uniref:response regulator transcription factor n=1 Tax=Rhodoferax sp. OV413 TaxID=1855285 RepID=UPI0025E261E3|nr:response regulator transcription factor [Rhodoferax sp. OV413]